ncbi:hypothetical protein D3C74_337020 [compost metagenome]
MFACSAWAMRAAYRSRVTRCGNASSGIQLAPRTNTGWSLTTNRKDVPCSSGSISRRTARKPTRRLAEPSRSRPRDRTTSTSWSGWSP